MFVASVCVCRGQIKTYLLTYCSECYGNEVLASQEGAPDVHYGGVGLRAQKMFSKCNVEICGYWCMSTG